MWTRDSSQSFLQFPLLYFHLCCVLSLLFVAVLLFTFKVSQQFSSFSPLLYCFLFLLLLLPPHVTSLSIPHSKSLLTSSSKPQFPLLHLPVNLTYNETLWLNPLFAAHKIKWMACIFHAHYKWVTCLSNFSQITMGAGLFTDTGMSLIIKQLLESDV